MPNQLADAAAWLAGQMKANESTTVTYCRGEQRVTFSATFGSSLLKLTDASGRVKIERTERDFIFTAADFDFGAGPETPTRGDVVEVPVGDKTERFEVTSPRGEPCYRYCDPQNVILRVHSKRTSSP